MSRNAFGLRVKSFCDSAKDRYFSRSHNDWRNMFINIYKKNIFLFSLTCFQNMSRWAENFKEHWNWVFFSFISKHFFQKFENFKTSYLSIINYLQLFSIFSIFLFLLVLFKLIPLWIVIYLIGHHWLRFIINVWLRKIVISKERIKNIKLVNNPLFSVLGCFHLSQSKISKGFDENSNYCQCKQGLKSLTKA